MKIITFHLTHFRNLTSAEFTCSPHFNLFFGDNAAGKTSILEAIYYLSNAKSFRTPQHDLIIQRTQPALTIFAELTNQHHIGLERSRENQLQLRMNHGTVRSISALAQLLPIQLISSDSDRILSDGPKNRRQLIDWGLFHTVPPFFQQWKSFQTVLELRNAALKAHASRHELLVWNKEFSAIAEQIHQSRVAYVSDFLPHFHKIMSVLLPNITIETCYAPGWDVSMTLEACLDQHVSRETLLGHTAYGPHRADWLLLVDGVAAHNILSQGQHKLVSYAMRLAQGLQLRAALGKSPIYLIDDLPSELDQNKRSLVTQILSNLDAQVFITGIKSADLDEIMALNSENRMFHVKQGAVLETQTEQCFT